MSKLKDKDYIAPFKFAFEIPEDLRMRADKLMAQYGMRRAIMTPILRDVLDMIEEHGNVVVGILIDENVKPREVIKSLNRAEAAAKKIQGDYHG